MSNDKKDYEIGYGKPPKKNRFKLGLSGNPKGRPKKRPYRRISMSELNQLIIDDMLNTVEVLEKGKKKSLPKLAVIISQLNNKAVTGDPRTAKMALEFMKIATEANDQMNLEEISTRLEMNERLRKGGRNPGSLDHLDALYIYYQYREEMRRIEGSDRWIFESGEPITREDWHTFINMHETLKREPSTVFDWPPRYPSDVEEEEAEAAAAAETETADGTDAEAEGGAEKETE